MAGQTLSATIQLANSLPAGATVGPVLTPLIHWVHVDASLNATIDGSGIFSFIGTTTIPLIGRGGKVAENLGDALTSFGLVDAIANAAGSTIGPLIKPVVAMGNLPVPLLDPEVPLITNTQNLTLNLGTVGFTLPGGRCAGVTCTAQDECHDVGTCDRRPASARTRSRCRPRSRRSVRGRDWAAPTRPIIVITSSASRVRSRRRSARDPAGNVQGAAHEVRRALDLREEARQRHLLHHGREEGQHEVRGEVECERVPASQGWAGVCRELPELLRCLHDDWLRE